MSLFTDALAGAGASAQSISGDMIANDLKDQLASKSDARQLLNSSQLQQQAAQIALHKEAFANSLQVQAHKDTTNFDNSPDVVGAAAAREGAITKSKSDNTVHDIAPGGQLFAGDGTMVAGNTNPTMVDLYKEGIRQSGSGGANSQAALDQKERAAAIAANLKDLDGRIQLTKFADPTTGQPDVQAYNFASQYAPMAVQHGASSLEADGLARAAVAKADAIAATLSTKPGMLWGDNSGSKDQVAAAAKLRAQVMSNMLTQMPEDKLRDPATYDPSKKAAATVSASPTAAPSSTPSASDGLPPARDVLTRLQGDAADVPSPTGIPAPPAVMDSTGRQINPTYQAWDAKFGDAYRAEQSTLRDRRKSASAASTAATNRSLFEAAQAQMAARGNTATAAPYSPYGF